MREVDLLLSLEMQALHIYINSHIIIKINCISRIFVWKNDILYPFVSISFEWDSEATTGLRVYQPIVRLL